MVSRTFHKAGPFFNSLFVMDIFFILHLWWQEPGRIDEGVLEQLLEYQGPSSLAIIIGPAVSACSPFTFFLLLLSIRTPASLSGFYSILHHLLLVPRTSRRENDDKMEWERQAFSITEGLVFASLTLDVAIKRFQVKSRHRKKELEERRKERKNHCIGK